MKACGHLYVTVYWNYFFLQYWGLSLGSHICQESTLPLNYIPNSFYLIFILRQGLVKFVQTDHKPVIFLLCPPHQLGLQACAIVPSLYISVEGFWCFKGHYVQDMEGVVGFVFSVALWLQSEVSSVLLNPSQPGYHDATQENSLHPDSSWGLLSSTNSSVLTHAKPGPQENFDTCYCFCLAYHPYRVAHGCCSALVYEATPITQLKSHTQGSLL